MSRRRTVVATAALFVGSGFLGSCGGDEAPVGVPRTTTSSTTAVDEYGSDPEEVAVGIDPTIQAEFGAAVEGLGLRITRAARYAALDDHTLTPTGKHLALYVEPVGAASPADYVDRIQPLADIFLPEVFDRIPELATMDVCQEPPPTEDPALVPKPYTQLIATRAQAEAIDWPNARVVDLLAAAVDHPNRLSLGAREPVSTSAAWKELYRSAVDQAAAGG